jgi:thymidylate synthase (FAD)
MRINVLDHGYVELVETYGSEQRIIEAARMSTQKGFEGWGPRKTEAECDKCGGQGITDDRGFKLGNQPYFCTISCTKCQGDGKNRVPGDEKLLRFLYEKGHSTPFEFAGLILEVQAPIFVFREWHRHRTQSYNEMSARYSPLPDMNYIPTVERLMLPAGKNKQAAAADDSVPLTVERAEGFRASLSTIYDALESSYQAALMSGVPKELARTLLPVGRYSRMRANANLRNWLGFLALRLSNDAQYEIRQYADAVSQIVSREFPRTWALYSTVDK